MNVQGQSIFSRKLAELRHSKIDRYYPPMAKNPELYNTASYYIRTLDLRNRFFHKFQFKHLMKTLSPSDLIRLKKLFVNDIIAAITGIEEEHIQWLLNHMEIKPSG